MINDTQKNIRKTKRIRSVLILATTLSFILFSAYFLFSFYKKSIKNIEDVELHYLKGIAQTLATNINGDEHEYLTEKYKFKDAIVNNEDDSIYLKINKILKAAQEVNNLKTDVYTLVLDKDAVSSNLTNSTFFGITSANPYYRHPYTPSLIFFDNYEKGGVIPPYGDEHGTWLSAFYPIRNSMGEVVAAVQVDLQFDEYLNKAKETSLNLVTISGIIALLIIIVIILLIYSISQQLLREQKSLAANFTSLNETYNKVTEFINKIAGGDLSKEYQKDNESDKLGESLIGLRNNLIKAEEDSRARKSIEEKQNWATRGLALFGDILRDNSDNLENLSYKIISSLVKHLNAKQGGMFVLTGNELEENGNTEELYFEQTAAYAYNRKKFTDKKIPFNEGLIGMVAKEKKTIFMTDIPENYLKITSGLGEANPNSILIVPLKINQEIFGIIEIASFEIFEKYQIDFVERIAESIATTLKSTKTKLRTEKLLGESREMTYQLQEQEEELRQNTEEMLATQEEMKIYQARLNSKFNSLDMLMAIFELDDQFNFININNKAQKLMHTSKKLINESLLVFNRSKQDQKFYNALFSQLKNEGYWEGNILFGGSSSFMVKITKAENEVNSETSYIGMMLE